MTTNLNLGAYGDMGGDIPPTSYMRNRVINGDMRISSYGIASGVPTTGNPLYVVDRFTDYITTSGSVTLSQSTDAPANNRFANSLAVTVNTADTSIGAADHLQLVQAIEGYNIQDLIGNTFTISFMVKSSVVGVYSVAVRNAADTSSYIMSYTVNQANVWEYKTLTLNGGLLASSVWNTSSGTGIQLLFVLMGGSAAVGAVNTWVTGQSTASSQVNLMATVGNVFKLTGVQLEVGSYASPFSFRHYSEELALCQRYFEKGTSIVKFVQYDDWVSPVFFNEEKRATPDIILSSPVSGDVGKCYVYASGADQSVVVGYMTYSDVKNSFNVTCFSPNPSSENDACAYVNWKASAELI